MTAYTPPLRDIRFVLKHIAGIESILAMPAYEHVDATTVDGALEEAGRFIGEIIAPTNRIGDEVGSQWVAGDVITPDAFKEAWGRYVDAGWPAVTGPVEFGGHGFPHVVGFAVTEMLVTANLALSLCPMLTGSAVTLLRDHGSDDQREQYLERLVTGAWTGTMVLSEPDAGSDLGAVRTTAEPAGDGTWRLNGTKIFITWGEHDLAENIIHFVLARIPGSPPGTKGLSLFLVPRNILDEDGNIGARNAVECVSLEHKLGINGSPTAVLAFDNAAASLVGEPNEGMRLMFTMMNQARVEVGLEGMGIAERAYQQAVGYAMERRQGRAVGTPRNQSSVIADHPDVRRMLMTMKANIEAMRGLLYDTAACVDRSHSPDDDVRSHAADRAALLTPVAKAWCTDLGVEMTSVALQVHGGMGFVEETGAAQHYRDGRITPIYEGSNGVQAADLVMRKLPIDGGDAVRRYLASIDALDASLGEAGEQFHGIRVALSDALGSLSGVTEWLLDRDDANDRLAAATPYLEMFGTVAGGYYLARQALHAGDVMREQPNDWLQAKIDIAAYYAGHLLPQAAGLTSSITAGAASVFAVDPEHLAAAP